RPMTRRAHTALWLVGGLFVGYAYFYQGGGWNQNSRFALVRAIVDEHTLRIDRTGVWDGHLITGDYARHDGHLYSDKAPGLALATGCLVGAFAAALALRDRPAAAGRDVLLGAAVGLLGGWATITEYPTAVPAAIIAIFALADVWPSGLGRQARVLVAVAVPA